MNNMHNIIKSAIAAELFTPMQKDVLSSVLEGLDEVGADLDSLTDYVLESIGGMRQCFMYADADHYYRMASGIDPVGVAETEESLLDSGYMPVSIAQFMCDTVHEYLQGLAHDICSQVVDATEECFVSEDA